MYMLGRRKPLLGRRVGRYRQRNDGEISRFGDIREEIYAKSINEGDYRIVIYADFSYDLYTPDGLLKGKFDWDGYSHELKSQDLDVREYFEDKAHALLFDEEDWVSDPDKPRLHPAHHPVTEKVWMEISPTAPAIAQTAEVFPHGYVGYFDKKGTQIGDDTFADQITAVAKLRKGGWEIIPPQDIPQIKSVPPYEQKTGTHAYSINQVMDAARYLTKSWYASRADIQKMMDGDPATICEVALEKGWKPKGAR